MNSPARAGTAAVLAVLGAAGLLLVLVTWASSIGPDRVVSGGHVDRITPTQPTTSQRATTSKSPLDELRHKKRGEAPSWVGVVAFALEVITLGVVLFLLGRLLRKARLAWLARSRRRRRRAEEVPFEVLGSAQQVSEAMVEDAQEQRTLLEVGGEPRNAIVECWQRFEQQAARAGVERRPWQTTAEFVLGVLDLVSADPGAVSRLAELYREARFSDHPMTDEHRADALGALDDLHRSLRPRAGSLRSRG